MIYPKKALEDLIDGSERKADRIQEVYQEIAKEMKFSRCSEQAGTGLADFLDDVKNEIKAS